MNPEVTIAILAFIAFSIPIVGALWKIFAVRERLQTQIQTVNHRVDLIETHFESFNTQHLASYNGLKELAGHIRARSTEQETKLNDRLVDIECFLEKTTTFQRRRS
jgi:N-acetyl-anhydromuramyl-L-alanine amidase AmpD